jgi:hypothetical protein
MHSWNRYVTGAHAVPRNTGVLLRFSQEMFWILGIFRPTITSMLGIVNTPSELELPMQ